MKKSICLFLCICLMAVGLPVSQAVNQLPEEVHMLDDFEDNTWRTSSADIINTHQWSRITPAQGGTIAWNAAAGRGGTGGLTVTPAWDSGSPEVRFEAPAFSATMRYGVSKAEWGDGRSGEIRSSWRQASDLRFWISNAAGQDMLLAFSLTIRDAALSPDRGVYLQKPDGSRPAAGLTELEGSLYLTIPQDYEGYVVAPVSGGMKSSSGAAADGNIIAATASGFAFTLRATREDAAGGAIHLDDFSLGLKEEAEATRLDFQGITAENLSAVAYLETVPGVTTPNLALSGDNNLCLTPAGEGAYISFLQLPGLGSMAARFGNTYPALSFQITNHMGTNLVACLRLIEDESKEFNSNDGYILEDRQGNLTKGDTSAASLTPLGFDWGATRYVVIPDGFEGTVYLSLASHQLQYGQWQAAGTQTQMSALTTALLDIRCNQPSAQGKLMIGGCAMENEFPAIPFTPQEIAFPDSVWQTPAVYPVPEKNEGDIQALFYQGLDYRGAETRVFAYVGLPQGASREDPVPAVVLLHGGGGTAYAQWVREWNARGYAAVAMDLEGHMPNGDSYTAQDWPGPSNTAFSDIYEKIEDQWMYHAIADAYLAHSLLASYDEVDAGQIGVCGISWGSVVTMGAVGLSDCFAFAVPIYGGAYMNESLTYMGGGSIYGNPHVAAQWEPSQWLDRVTAQTLYVNGDADIAFSLNITDKAFAQTGNARLCVVPGLKHGHSEGWAVQEPYAFADSITRGSAALPLIVKQPTAEDPTVSVLGDQSVSAILRYSLTGLQYGDDATTFTGTWSSRVLTPGTDFSLHIPSGTQCYYVTVTDSRGMTASTRLVSLNGSEEPVLPEKLDFEDLIQEDISSFVTTSPVQGYAPCSLALAENGVQGSSLVLRNQPGIAQPFLYELKSPILGIMVKERYTQQPALSAYLHNKTGVDVILRISGTLGGDTLDSNDGYLLKDMNGKVMKGDTCISQSIPDYGWADGRYLLIPAGFEGWVYMSLQEEMLQQGQWNTQAVSLAQITGMTFDFRGVYQDVNVDGSIYLDDLTTAPEMPLLSGDANADGIVNAQDIIEIKQALLGMSSLASAQKKAADVNGDGDVNILDIVLIKRMIAKM